MTDSTIATPKKSFDYKDSKEVENIYEKNVFSTADISAYITLANRRSYKLGNLSLLSISTHRDKFPVTSLGRIRVKGFTSSIRSIAGTLAFSSFDRTVFNKLIIDPDEEHVLPGVLSLKNKETYRQLADELPPFDITAAFVNEFGKVSYTSIIGVTILDQGVTYSIDNINLMETYSYMAIDIIPFQPYNPLDLKLPNNQIPSYARTAGEVKTTSLSSS